MFDLSAQTNSLTVQLRPMADNHLPHLGIQVMEKTTMTCSALGLRHNSVCVCVCVYRGRNSRSYLDISALSRDICVILNHFKHSWNLSMLSCYFKFMILNVFDAIYGLHFFCNRHSIYNVIYKGCDLYKNRNG